MGDSPIRTPGYLLHKSSGQARVRIHGRDFYLGTYNSPISWQRYHQLVAQYFGAPAPPPEVLADPCTSVAHLVARYVEFADQHFRYNPDERYRIKAAINPLIKNYGSIAVADFSPKKLKDVRQHIIDRRNARTGKPLCRKYVNQLTAIIKKIFKWGVSEELVPVVVFQALDTVPGLQKGRVPGVVESKRIKPVPEEHISAILAFLQPEVATMIQVQLWAGMRRDEVTVMTPQSIDRTGDVWKYTIPSRFEQQAGESIGSKTDWLENVDRKEILLGPKSQQLLEVWISQRAAHEYLFSFCCGKS